MSIPTGNASDQYLSAFKKYDHFAGNYGGSWWHQQREFDSFGGAITDD